MEQRTFSYIAKAPLEETDAGRTQEWGGRTWREKSPTVDARVRESLWTGHRYRNDLTALTREFHALRVTIRAPYTEAREAEYRRRKEAGEKEIKLPKIQLSEFDTARLKKAQKDLNEARRGVARGSDALWGTRGQVDASIDQALSDACKAKSTKKGYFPSGLPPGFSRWDGSGLIAVQCQGGLPVPEMLAGGDTRVRLVGAGERRTLWLRIGSEERAPVWAKFPIRYCRDLPPHAVIKWVRVLAVRRATKLLWKAQFILEGEGLNPLPTPTEGAVGIDIGWRIRPNGVRVAVWTNDTGATGELLLPRELITGWEKAESLQSIRDQAFNDTVAALALARETRGDRWPEWLKQETRYVAQWQKYKSANRLARLCWQWRKESHKPGLVPADLELLRVIESWRKQDKHLYEWQANQTARVLDTRKYIYRCFAKDMATKYRQVAVEEMDLRDFAELPEEDEPKDSPSAAAARPRRFKVALSTLREALLDAVVRADGEWVTIEPAHTTKKCATCGTMNVFDAAKNLEHTCSGCGQAWDQDANAARNLLRAAQRGESVAQRSNAQTRVVESENKLRARRERLASMLAARRSKKTA